MTTDIPVNNTVWCCRPYCAPRGVITKRRGVLPRGKTGYFRDQNTAQLRIGPIEASSYSVSNPLFFASFFFSLWDALYLLLSIVCFSLPVLSLYYRDRVFIHLLPYALPMAQVRERGTFWCIQSQDHSGWRKGWSAKEINKYSARYSANTACFLDE